ncbi:MAG: hypothetical protein NXH75_12010, partial [Halobacteriovoraceae bacterium]|nr:hypothetical protein [Halobacteriovoraceae bacterium]
AGEHDQNEIKELSLDRSLDPIQSQSRPFIGLPHNEKNVSYLRDQHIQKSAQDLSSLANEKNKDLFITSPYVAEHLPEGTESSLWASGSRTMKKLASLGHWVKGSSDSLGEETLEEIRNSSLINLFLGNANWLVLTNDTSQSKLGETYPAYKKEYTTISSPEYSEQIEKCEHFYWTSFPQFDFFNKTYNMSKSANHYCGLGKTYKKFQENNIPVTPMGSMKELKDYFDINEESQ